MTHLKRINDYLNCMVCRGPNPGACRESGVTYEISCMLENGESEDEKCAYVYIGQTGRNAYVRGKEHMEAFRLKGESSVLWEHCEKVHDGEKRCFVMKVVDRCRNDPVKRQVLEAVRMNKVPEERRMNRRGEWNMIYLPNLRVTV